VSPLLDVSEAFIADKGIEIRITSYKVSKGCCAFYERRECEGFMFNASNREDSHLQGVKYLVVSLMECELTNDLYSSRTMIRFPVSSVTAIVTVHDLYDSVSQHHRSFKSSLNCELSILHNDIN
jgi:hypothetical protein